MTTYTPNYNLDLYEDSDKPNLRDQYNSAMGKVDTELKTLADSDTSTGNLIAGINREIASIQESVMDISETAQDAQTTANAAQTTASAAQTAASSAATAASEAQSTASAAQSAASTAQGTANTAQSTAESAATTASAAQTTANAAQTAASSAATAASDAQSDATSAINRLNTIEQNHTAGMTQLPAWSASNNNYDGYILYAHNADYTMIKIYGTLTRKVGAAFNATEIPGRSGTYGIKTTIQTGIPNIPAEGYLFTAAGINYDTESGKLNGMGNAAAIGTDGFIYVYTTNTPTFGAATVQRQQAYFQIPFYLGVPFELDVE